MPRSQAYHSDMKPLFTLLFVSLLPLSLWANHHEVSTDSYPLPVCVVSGKALGSMGAPTVYWHHVEGQPDREVRFCCEHCVERFQSHPEKYLAKLDAVTVGQSDCCADKTCADCADGDRDGNKHCTADSCTSCAAAD